MIRTELDAFAATIARLLIGGFFALSGANNLLDISLATERAAEAGVPMAPLFVVIVALFKLTCGILIMIRHHTKLAASLLILYLIATSIIFYNPLNWGQFPQSETIFMRNVAILGGLLFLYAHSRGMSLVRPQEEIRLSSRVSDEELNEAPH